MKRAFDILVSALLLIVLVLPILFIALVVRISIGSPVLFRQQRPGLHGKVFHLIKFRTMTDKRDSDGNLLSDNQRLTSAGRILRATSLDELPELWNVLKGDMSLVGPRPLLLEYLPLYNDRQSRRHEVRPGITGLAQVNGRNSISWEEKFELDVRYVETHSFLMDMGILIKTLWTVPACRDINDGKTTMTAFKGTPKPDEDSMK